MDYAPCHRKMERAGIIGVKPLGIGDKRFGVGEKPFAVGERAVSARVPQPARA